MRRLLILAVFLTGCSHTTTWDHPTKSENQFYADDARCSAMSQGGGSGGTGGYYQGGDAFTDGYMRGQAIGSSFAAKRRQKQIYGNCMRGEGWRS